MDKVFVITVCRNAGELLEPTMLSVLNQMYANLSYIIVDGGSIDGSIDVIQKYKDQLAAWVSEPDKGIYDAMNKGVNLAKSLLKEGETAWVNFMNAGDCFTDANVVSDVFCRDIAESVKVVVGHFNRCYGEKKTTKAADRIDLLPLWMPFCHQSTFVKLEYCNFDTSYKMAADYNLFYNLYDKYGSDIFLCVDRVVSEFQMEGSTTYNNLSKVAWEGLRIRSKHKNIFWWKLLIKYVLWRCRLRTKM